MILLLRGFALNIIPTFLRSMIFFSVLCTITKIHEKDTQRLELVETTKPIVYSILCLFLQFFY